MVEARKLAAKWRSDVGQETRFTNGPDHPTLRGKW